MMIAAILQRFCDGPIVGVPQAGIESYKYRRTAKDNLIDISRPFFELIPHLRASERRSPAYFVHQGCKYFVEVFPEQVPQFPDDLEISFPELVGYDHPA
jgi:methionyl-tRNA formyltransferase